MKPVNYKIMRSFISALLFVVFYGFFLPLATEAQPAHHMVIQADQPQETINKHIYGHFSEHLGRGIYDGIWQEDEDGQYRIRQDVVEALKAIGIPNLRWPGGCFADYYFWEYGIGPQEERPEIINALWGGVVDDNAVGTHEFMDLVGQLDTEAIIVGNVGSGTVQEMSRWWEYVNHPGPGSMADLREEHGRADPWDVRFWGVGNESWGCGGNMRPEYYADQYRQFATFLHPVGNVQPFRIAAGAAGDDFEWTEVMMQRAADHMDGLDLHHYTITGTWAEKGDAIDFTEAEWFELMEGAFYWDELLSRHKTIMDKYDPEKRIWLIVGEWGTWHEPMEGSNPGFLHQQNTLRDALSASVSLDMFHRHLDRVKMANIAQTVNVLQAMILTDGDDMLLTPTYHVFDFYTVHHDADYLSFSLEAGEYRYGEEDIPALTATASRDQNGQMHITMTNLDPSQARTVEVDIRGESVNGASGRILTAETMNAHNTFDEPMDVQPQLFESARVADGKLIVELPAKSLVVLEVD